MGSTLLSSLSQQSRTAGNALSAVSFSTSNLSEKTAKRDSYDIAKHLSLLQQLEELRSSLGHNYGGDDGVTNGTTPVTIVPSPSTGFLRLVKSVLVYNVDTATAIILLIKDNGSSERIFYKESLTTLVSGNFNDPVVLTSTDKLEIKLSGAVSTTELDWVTSWRDFDAI